MILGITGHRPNKLGGYNDRTNRSSSIQQALQKQFEEIQPQCILTGMALGVDQWAAEVAISLKIPFAAMIPCQKQDRLWPSKSQQYYRELLDQADKVIQCSDLPYAPELMKKRNERIVEACTLLLAVWDGSSGGTSHTVWYARDHNKPVRILHPVSLALSEV